MKRVLLVTTLASVVLPAQSANAQGFAPRESVTVAPGPQYKAGGLHRFFFGNHYRKLWTTPIRVPVLRLGQFAGGLTPLRSGGGMQTKSLRFRGANGRQYVFRSLDKDPTTTLPPELRATFAGDIYRDQLSATHPAGALLVGPILEAAGVLHTNPIMVQLADDPGLGEFRREYGGKLGTIEERPAQLGDEGTTFAGASAVVSTGDLLTRLDADATVPVDARAFLLARLTDVFVGDWDRHQDQWRWALVGAGERRRWLPIPRDRDQAFVRLDGFLMSRARTLDPKLLNFGPSYGNITGMTWNGRDLDRRFLAGLERPVWDSTARSLKSRLTDAVLAQAVQGLPPEYRPLEGARFAEALRARRDQLDQVAVKYYELLAAQVEIYATNQADEARVSREPDGVTLVTLAHNRTEYFRRRFDPGETRSIRVHLQGGDDSLGATGAGRGSPRVRVVGGPGNDVFTVSGVGGIHLYDEQGNDRAEGGGINRKPWHPKPAKSLPFMPDSLQPNELPRDWGHRTWLSASAAYSFDVQAVLGYGGYTDWYGFRRVPYQTRLDYRLELATGRVGGRATIGLTRRFENSTGFYRVEALGSTIQLSRWYGFGSDSLGDQSASYYQVDQNEIAGAVKLGFRFGERNEFSAGPVVRWSYTNLAKNPNAGRFIAVDQPYGVGRFGMLGASAQLRLEGRDHPHFATRGGYLSLRASAYPAVWSATDAIGIVEAEAGWTLAPRGEWPPTLNLTAGAVESWGELPYFAAPTLGGARTLRGFLPNRFAGDAVVYGSAELRVPLTRLQLILPGRQGLFAFSDAGRVYREGDTSDRWHASFGGGIWLAFLNRDNVLYLGAGKPTRGSEPLRFLAGFGFPY